MSRSLRVMDFPLRAGRPDDKTLAVPGTHEIVGRYFQVPGCGQCNAAERVVPCA